MTEFTKGEKMKRFLQMMISALFIYVISIGYAYSQGRINVQNGNISHFYQDFNVPGHGFPLKFDRSYNSLSKFQGLLGHRWGTEYDISFHTTPEGTVEITEFGGGFKTTFAPKGYSKKDVDKFIMKILNKLPPASRTAKLKTSLKTDTILRHKLAREHKVIVPINFDQALHANDRGPETLKKIKKRGTNKFTWVRGFTDGSKEHFNSKGELVRKVDTNGNYLKLDYKHNLLTSVTDRNGRKISFFYDSNKKLKQIKTPDGKVCTFKVDKNGNLIYAKNVRGFEFKYEYDSHHRLITVIYPKGRKEIMKYDAQDRINHHEGPEDIKTKYKYDTKGNPEKYFFVTVTKDIGKGKSKVVTVDKYEYEFGRRNNGTKFTYKLTEVLDGVRTETVYTPCCGKPISINRDGRITRFEYNDAGALTKKVFPTGRMVSLQYDKKVGKVSKVIKANPKAKKTDVTSYKYDKRGNLAFAQNKGKKISVQLIYDTKGRIKKMIDQTGKEILFNYNELGKPTRITLKGIGSINVSYNASGEITNVKSTGGRKIASEVTSAFQTLLDVIRPAGVSLNI